MTLAGLLVTWLALTAIAVTVALMAGYCHGWDECARATGSQDRLDDA